MDSPFFELGTPVAAGLLSPHQDIAKSVKSDRVVLRARRAPTPPADTPEDPPRNLTIIKGYAPFAGAQVGNLSPALADELRMDPRETGVVVTAVKGGRAYEVGFRRRDILKKVNGVVINTVGDLVRVARGDPEYWRLDIKRRGRVIKQELPGY